MAEQRFHLVVARDLEASFDEHKHLLPGRELSRAESADRQYVVVTMTDPQAPTNAARMCPVFTQTGDRVELDHIDYYDADGLNLN
ncbi:hypothetical protein [Streptomyces sp. NPDC059783]|uniref:hypothetical protein n=1 Tax=Streptomyces sp. NPDC059783 TaxID=3346944 RepID=UPI003657312C